MLYKPSLSLKRLIVVKDGDEVYNEVFNQGVNIIRGENGSGKTTVSDFIFHVLGGEVYEWREHAKSCDTVIGELQINDDVITVKRDIDQGKSYRPMLIYWGSFSESEGGSITEWEKYPYSDTKDKNSFSHILFEALGIPKVKGDLQSRVTMHQLLRLMYIDQFTPADQVFIDEQFDRELTRETVGDLVCGIEDSELYRVQIKLNKKEKDLSNVRASLKNIRSVIGDISEDISIPQLKQRKDQLQAERKELLRKEGAEKDDSSEGTRESQQQVVEIRERLSSVKRDIDEAESTLEEIDFEIADSDQFIHALKRRKKALSQGAVVRSEIGSIPFNFCPACYAQLEDNDNEQKCKLCKNTIELGDPANNHRLKREQEIDEQIKESQQIQEERVQEKKRLEEELPQLKEQRQELQARYDGLASDVGTTDEQELKSSYTRIGYINRQIEDIDNRIRIFGRLDSLKEERDQLASQVGELKEQRDILEKQRDDRRVESYHAIEKHTKDYLMSDLEREDEFVNPERVSFDFGKDSVKVNGRANYAASSMVYLKNCFHLALFSVSLSYRYFNYPRFVFFDNVEDKGMEPKRSHNFQELMVEVSENAEVDHQIIFTTSMLSPELKESKYLIGPAYTKQNKTLNLD